MVVFTTTLTSKKLYIANNIHFIIKFTFRKRVCCNDVSFVVIITGSNINKEFQLSVYEKYATKSEYMMRPPSLLASIELTNVCICPCCNSGHRDENAL